MNTTMISGSLGIVHTKRDRIWTLRNGIRPGYIFGWLSVCLAKLLTKLTGIPTITSELRMRHNDVDLGVVGRRVVTTVGVNFIVDAWQNSVELEIMKYHGCGTGAVAEAVGDSALGAESTTILNPDSTRATGTLAEGSTANIFSSVGVLTFDGSGAITEHGLFSQAATGGGVLFDRTVFAARNVVTTDTLTFTYQATFNAGG